MKLILLAVVIIIGLLFGPARIAQAQTPAVISKITADDLAQMLWTIGFFAAVNDENGEKVVIPYGFFNHAVKSEVRLQQCSDGGCSRLVFKNWPNLRADQKWVTNWDGGPVSGLVKASLLKDSTIRLEMTVDLEGGVSPQFIEQSAFAFVTLIDRIWPNSGLH